MSKDKTITVSEFRYWLEGVEEMQPEGWSPDKRQWDRIRDKINQLEATVVVQPTQQYQQPTTLYREEVQPADPNRPVQFAGGGLPRMAAPPPNNQLFGNADAPGIPTRTPNVDTSTGHYEPAFV